MPNPVLSASVNERSKRLKPLRDIRYFESAGTLGQSGP